MSELTASNEQAFQSDHARLRQEAIVAAFADFVEDLKLVDAVDFISYIRLDQHGNLEELVNSSAELFFKEGSLRYSMAAESFLEWDTPPVVSIDLEFFNKGVWIYFTIVLAFPDNSVNVTYVEIPEAQSDKTRETEMLVEALKDARIS